MSTKPNGQLDLKTGDLGWVHTDLVLVLSVDPMRGDRPIYQIVTILWSDGQLCRVHSKAITSIPSAEWRRSDA